MTWSACLLAGLTGICGVLALVAANAQFDATIRLLLNLAFVVGCWLAAGRIKNRLSAMSFYVPFSALYLFSGMLEIATGNRLGLNPERMTQLMNLGTVFLFAALVAWVLVFRPRPPSPTLKMRSAIAARAVYLCLGLLIVCIVLALQRYGVGIGQLTRGELYADEYIVLSLARSFLAPSLGVTAALIVASEIASGRRESRLRAQLIVTLVLYAILDLAVLGDRRMPLMALLAVLVIFRSNGVPFKYLALGGVLLFLLGLYGMVRNIPVSNWGSIIASVDFGQAFNPASTEFGNGVTIMEALIDPGQPPADFPGYADTLKQLVPRALLPNRPESPTEWFARTHFPEIYAIGGSFAFNAVIEAMLNGGLLGVMLAGLGTGFVMGAMANWRWRGAPVGLALCTYIFVFSMRMDATSIMRTGLMAFIGIGLLLFLTVLPGLLAPLQQKLRTT